MVDLRNAHILVGDNFVSADIERHVQAIKDYEPEIDVRWVPPAAREPGVAAFKIVHCPPDGQEFTLFHVNTEEEFDARVLQRIIANDQRNGKASLSEYEAWEAAQQLIAKRKYLDDMEEARDIARHVIGTKLNTYRVNKDIVIKDGIPFNAKNI